ncbi:hypothetical protein EYF80_019609 [Liparis tanakae]|uniref:Uncharacterized protein n=1 Tax=Liparis tanakae TaxID=230148 RepID=A0A4Z2HW95_9TELE|nr:hypothetical protein EYF80_019609 [Liparis tanakae]
MQANEPILTAVLYSLAEQHAHGVDDAGGGGAVDSSTQRQQETSLNTNQQHHKHPNFAELVVAGRRISKDFNPIQTHLDMGADEKRNRFSHQSSAHISVPMQVSLVESTQSPNGTVS